MGIAKRHVQIGGISSVEHLPGDFFEGQTVWFFESGFNEWDYRKGTIVKVYKKVADVDFGSDEQRVSLQRLFTEYHTSSKSAVRLEGGERRQISSREGASSQQPTASSQPTCLYPYLG